MTALALPAGIRTRLTSPSAVMIATMAAMNVIRIGNTVVLTRLLAPRDFGLAGIMFSTFYIISMLTDTGYQAFVVRDERGDETRFLDVVWTLHVMRGFAICALVLAIAWPLGLFTRKPDLVPLLLAAAPYFIVDGFNSTALFSAVRHGAVRRLSLIDFAANIAQVIFGLASAAVLHNAYAIVVATFAGALTKLAASYLIFPGAARRFGFDSRISRELWRFSRVIAASSVIALMISQVDKVVLVRQFTLTEFGIYSIAVNLAAAPLLLANLYVMRIIYPAVARAARDTPDRVRDALYTCRGLAFYGFLFAGGGLIGGASILVNLIYDPRYAGAAFYLSLLAITSAMAMLSRSISESLVAIGTTRASLSMNLVRLAWLIVVGGAALALRGPIGFVVVLGTMEIPAYLYGLFALRRHGLLDIRREAMAVGLLLAGVAIGYLASLELNHILAR